MCFFRIIPVIDILNAQAVHAIKGERAKYELLKSKLLPSSNPLKIITFLKNNLQFNEIYIADLDAIIKRKPNYEVLLKILKISDLKLMLDPGIIYNNDLYNFSNLKLNKLILGIETIKNFSVIEKALEIFSQEKLIVSLDMYQGKIFSNNKELKNENPLNIAKKLDELGINELILLDLFRVGQKMGGIPSLFHKIRQNFKGDILIGGGTKDINDLKRFRSENFSGVLIATALYDGTINIEEIKNLQKKY